MKCLNCRTENNPAAIRCQNCNAPLSGSMVLNSNEIGHIKSSELTCNNCKSKNPVDALRCVECNAPLSGSMVLNSPNPYAAKDNEDDGLEKGGNRMKICPTCSYPNLPAIEECVRCNTSLKREIKKAVEVELITDTQNKKRVEAVKFSKKTSSPFDVAIKSSKKGTNTGKTINPWVQSEQASTTFSLTAIDTIGENGASPLEFEGEEVKLSRKNLDPSNITITSQTQAIIRKKGGAWHLVNKSSLQTTFLRVDKEIELQSGDIILLGNRQFRFED